MANFSQVKNFKVECPPLDNILANTIVWPFKQVAGICFDFSYSPGTLKVLYYGSSAVRKLESLPVNSKMK